jgi:hypothetical protein
MPQTLTESKEADEQFFEAVMRGTVLRQTLQRYGFNKQTIFPSQHNSVLVITKDEWTLYPAQRQTKALNIHFEARKRDELRLEIALEPYEGNVANKPDLFRQIQPLLTQKAQIIRMLRARVSNTNVLPTHIQVSTKYLPDPDEVRAQTIVKFIGTLPSALSPAQSASFFAEIVQAVTPLVESSIAAMSPF